jgi:hypothetical protein
MDWKEHGIKIVWAGDLDTNTPQTAGMTRAAAITHARTGASKFVKGGAGRPRLLRPGLKRRNYARLRTYRENR